MGDLKPERIFAYIDELSCIVRAGDLAVFVNEEIAKNKSVREIISNMAKDQKRVFTLYEFTNPRVVEIFGGKKND